MTLFLKFIASSHFAISFAFMSAAYASGGSATESEDESAHLQVKSEPKIHADYGVVESSVVVKSEVVESQVIKQEEEEVAILKKFEHEEEQGEVQEFPILTTIKQELEEEQEEGEVQEQGVEREEGHIQEEVKTPPRCSVCGYPRFIAPQVDILKSQAMLQCKCCNLVLPDTSFSKTQRRKEDRKCIACTGNAFRGAKPLSHPSRQKPIAPRSQNKKTAARSHEASAVFTNKVGRLKMAQRALQRKRDEASKLKMTKRREEYEEQLNKEEMDLERQSVLLKRANPSAYQNLMNKIKIKKPPTYKEEKKKKSKKKNDFAEKRKAKRQADDTPGQANKKRKGPVVDSSVYIPPGSAADGVSARVIPTRSMERSQPKAAQFETISVKNEIMTELPKREVKTESLKAEGTTE